VCGLCVRNVVVCAWMRVIVQIYVCVMCLGVCGILCVYVLYV